MCGGNIVVQTGMLRGVITQDRYCRVVAVCACGEFLIVTELDSGRCRGAEVSKGHALQQIKHGGA